MEEVETEAVEAEVTEEVDVDVDGETGGKCHGQKLIVSIYVYHIITEDTL